jgi:hypothetical protein
MQVFAWILLVGIVLLVWVFALDAFHGDRIGAGRYGATGARPLGEITSSFEDARTNRGSGVANVTRQEALVYCDVDAALSGGLLALDGLSGHSKSHS